jgi:hypothetical protein
MCDGDGSVAAATPRAAPGPVVDPITLEPVDEVETPVDNVFDALLPGDERVTRPPLTAQRLPLRSRRTTPTDNADRLGIDLRGAQGVVLSPGHGTTPWGWPGWPPAPGCR